MNVAVLGAGGTIAPAIVRDLAESDEVESLLLLDLDLDRAARVAAEHGGGKALALQVDATAARGEPGSLADELETCEVLVNSASYRVNLAAMRACLEAETHYIDLGGLYWIAGEQLELHAEFERAGLLAALGVGSAPGKTNLMGAMAATALGGDLDEAHALAAGRDLEPPEGPSFPYAVRTLVDEVTIPPVVVREGKVVEVEPLSSGGAVDFGDPIGPAETILTLHTETLTFPQSFRCSECTFRLSLPPAVLDRLRELAAGTDADVEEAARTAVPPSPNTVAVHMVQARRGDRTARVRAVTRPMERWGIGGGIVSTAAPAAAAVRLLARGRIEARGALPPERCVDPAEMFKELEPRGCTHELEVGQVETDAGGADEGDSDRKAEEAAPR